MLLPPKQELSRQQATPACVPHAAQTPPWQRVPGAVQTVLVQQG
jgi:hypothetical protein